MDFSIVIPLLNEAESLPELHKRIVAVMRENGWSYEVIFIDDGSSDASWQVINTLSKNDSNVRGIRFRRNYGKAQALDAAFQVTRGKYVVTMDADLQDFPEEIPELYLLLSQGYDLVSGWKEKRKDPVLSKNLPSKLFNWVARKTSGLDLHDFNCGLKIYRSEVVKSIRLHSDMHRYIPVLAKQKGFGKITEKRVQHVARKHGKSKFGNRRFINGFLDLITISFLNRFGTKPMHIFGAFGLLMMVIGFFSASYIGVEKLYISWFLKEKARLVTENPFFYIALTSMLIGTQLFLAGFLGEIMIRLINRRVYQIQEEI